MKHLLVTLLFLVSVGFYGQTAEEYIQNGADKYGQGDYKGALEDYTKAIELKPSKNDWMYNMIGEIKYNLKDYAGAIQDYNKASKLNPENSETYYWRGLAKNNAGDKKGACKDWKKAGELGIKDAYVLINKYCK